MPSIKKSLMISEDTFNYIDARTKHEADITWSQAVNEGFRALKWLTDEALPELDVLQWHHILNVYSGTLLEFRPPFRIASDIMDDAGAISVDEVSPMVADLVRRTHNMSQLEQFAVLDFVQKFWAGEWSECVDFGEIFEKIKAL